MSSPLRVGVPVLKMLPITGTWAVPFTAYLIYLSNRVVFRRLSDEKYVGDRSDKASTDDARDPLLLETRAHNNFLENVPFAFALVTIAELNGANRKILNYAMATLFVLRIAHVELGLRGNEAMGYGRPVGYYGTQGFLAAMAGYCGWLSKDYWGY
ncbi:hypothetical protein MMC21_002096 [Puttea exsequens]|nr:hypothetical protein [Puttea exsequens]